MRPRMIIAGLMLTLAGSLAAPARAEDGYRHGRLRFVEPGVSLQRATGVGAEEADANEPFLPGDRVWTNAAGRAEFQFPDGSLVRLDRRSKLDYSGHEERDAERIVLRLWSGSLFLRVRARDARFEIETPAGTVRGLERSLVRVDVDAGEARVSVYEGEAILDDGRASVRLAAGERTYARWGGRAEEPQRFDLDEEDEFARWNADQEAQDRRDARSARYLPDELDTYASEFDSNGDWSYETTVGYVWMPRVEVGWQPYSHGRWCWTPYGWTWVPNERWGWAPSHYGRWGHGQRGWYWIPGRTWGPAWVSWAVGGGYVGWCPLGSQDRPVRDWDSHRGARGSAEVEAWSVVRQGELAHRDLAQRRVRIDRSELMALQVAESPRLRPTRDAMHLREGEQVASAISTRPTPGDFVRELAVDNKTTIPAPWFRRGGVSTGGDGQIRYERDRATGSAAQGTLRRGGEPAPGETAGRGEVHEGSRPRDDQENTQRSLRRAPDSSELEAPAAAPQARDSGSHGESQRSRDDGAQTSHQRDTGSSWARPSGDSAAARPRGGESRSSGASESRSQPARGEARSSGGSESRSQPAGGEARPSGGRSKGDAHTAQKREQK
jgi:hypothetical protein